MIPVNANFKKKSNDRFNTEYLKKDLTSRSVRGGATVITSHAIIFFLKLTSTIILARILVPADFGMIAMVTAITGLATIFSDFGLGTATIQQQEINHAQLSTLFWISAALGTLVAVFVFAVAPVIAMFYDDPRLTKVTMALGTTFFLGGLAIQHQAMLTRHMRFFALSLITVLSMLIGITVAITVAFLGGGYWALVLMHISIALILLIGKWVAFPWRPGMPKRGIGVGNMIKFGTNLTIFNIVNYFARNADNVLIGKFLGPISLGFYSKAYGLLMLPLQQISAPFNNVSLPALSRLREDNLAYERYYLKLLYTITLITSPMIIFMTCMSRDLIMLFLGDQWIATSDIFSILGIGALIQPIYFTQGILHISSGHSRRYLNWGVLASCVILSSFIIGIPFGTLGVATAYTVAMYILITPAMWYAGHSANIKLSKIISAVRINIFAALTGGLILYIITLSSAVSEHSIYFRLTMSLLLFMILYFVSLIFFNKSFKPVRDILLFLRIASKSHNS